ncbi:M56 family metallopeptidase [Streptomyces sp. KE1]|uniref:M56 family metallopeptidase n=1 Tax=Streptomyces sp. KE1 TaxID=1638939 RepID=UPI00063EC356|nr:M56 family metallopeptidase [Streptomyces sp. KE1]KLJ03865.1 membrane protein [Streptomyces sp. KE1]
MGLFVFLPLILPLTAHPIARLAEQHLHPRTGTRLLAGLSLVLAVCSTLCLALLVVAGTARLPGNPLPDAWAAPEVRAVVPYDEVTGSAALIALLAALTACALALVREARLRLRTRRALAGLPGAHPAVLPDPEPYAYALPGRPGRIVVSRAMLESLDADERHALLAHEQAHLDGRHHRLLLAVRLAACLNPLLRPLRSAVAYGAERWADEEAAMAVGDRRLTARAVGRAALSARSGPAFGLAFAEPAPGPVPRRVAALLGPAPSPRRLPPAMTRPGLAFLMATTGAAASAASSANAALTLLLVLKAATPL